MTTTSSPLLLTSPLTTRTGSAHTHTPDDGFATKPVIMSKHGMRVCVCEHHPRRSVLTIVYVYWLSQIKSMHPDHQQLFDNTFSGRRMMRACVCVPSTVSVHVQRFASASHSQSARSVRIERSVVLYLVQGYTLNSFYFVEWDPLSVPIKPTNNTLHLSRLHPMQTMPDTNKWNR